MSATRLLILSLLLSGAACAPPAPRLETRLAQTCRTEVESRGNALVRKAPTAVRMREDWVQVDGVVEWSDAEGVRSAWTCDLFRGEDGKWHRQYLSFGPV